MGFPVSACKKQTFETEDADSPDGIGEIATDGDACIDAIYDIEGKRGNGISRGLNIIRMSDGTTRKVLK